MVHWGVLGSVIQLLHPSWQFRRVLCFRLFLDLLAPILVCVLLYNLLLSFIVCTFNSHGVTQTTITKSNWWIFQNLRRTDHYSRDEHHGNGHKPDAVLFVWATSCERNMVGDVFLRGFLIGDGFLSVLLLCRYSGLIQKPSPASFLWDTFLNFL